MFIVAIIAVDVVATVVTVLGVIVLRILHNVIPMPDSRDVENINWKRLHYVKALVSHDIRINTDGLISMLLWRAGKIDVPNARLLY